VSDWQNHVHLPAGYVRTGTAVSAVCHCGWSTAPLAQDGLALLAFAQGHGWTVPICVLCGRDRSPDDADLAGMHANLQVVPDPGGDPPEMLICRTELDTCRLVAASTDNPTELDSSQLPDNVIAFPSVGATSRSRGPQR
jgi:hypothetical protein